MARRMADPEFQKQQWEDRKKSHIAPFNRLVDELCNDGRMPYIAPIYGGVNAKMLSILRDPGPMTQLKNNGSGMLCLENDDATAERMCELIAEAGIDATEMMPWNAFPWYIQPTTNPSGGSKLPAPNAAQLNAGIAPLKRLIDLLPMLQVVILHGGTAHNCWKKFTQKHPNIVEERKIYVIETYHTSRQAFRHPDEKVREARKQHLQDSLRKAASILHQA